MRRHVTALAWHANPGGVAVLPQTGDTVAALFVTATGQVVFDIVHVDVVLSGGRLVTVRAQDVCRSCGSVLYDTAGAVLGMMGRVAARPSRIVAWVRLQPLDKEGT